MPKTKGVRKFKRRRSVSKKKKMKMMESRRLAIPQVESDVDSDVDNDSCSSDLDVHFDNDQVVPRSNVEQKTSTSEQTDGKACYITCRALLNTIRAAHPCCYQDENCLELYEDKSERQGHIRCLKVKCNSCKLNIRVDENPWRQNTCFREHVADNRRFAFAADCSGLDYEGLKLICSILNLPGPPDSYDNVHQTAIHASLKQNVEALLEKNRRETFLAYTNKDGSSIARISVKSDGTYQKRGDRRRGYTSNVGIIIISDAVTDKVLDYEILNKYCHTCTAKRKVLDEDEFETWFVDEHMDCCDRNFQGGSSNMEREAVLKMFKRSKNFKLMYEYLVGDGDSKAFLDIWDVYGVCEHCERIRPILTQRAGEEYEKWRESEDYRTWLEAHENGCNGCNAVKKIDCVQHVGKCFRDKLEELAKNPRTKVSDGKSVNRGHHRLGPGARIKLQKYFSSAVRSSIQPGVLTDSELSDACENMRRAIFASLYHSLMLADEEKRHSYCPNVSWCAFKRGNRVEAKEHHLEACFEAVLLPIYKYYTQPSILRRMVPGMNTNCLESFNSMVWSILPKIKYHGSRRTEIAVMLSIFWQQEGKKSLPSLMANLNLDVSEDSVAHFHQLDKKREKQTAKRKSCIKQRYEKRLESALEQYTDIKSYHPGVCDAGAGPSADMMSTPFVMSSTTNTSYHPTKSDFVVLPYGPSWYIAKIEEVLHDTREVCVDFVYHNGDGSYSFKEEGDPGYEGLVYEPFSLILMTVPEPSMNRISNTRHSMQFPKEVLDRVQAKFIDWKERKRHPKRLNDRNYSLAS